MGSTKRKTNGHNSKKKKIKAIDQDEQDLAITYFESEATFHSTVTRMKVNELIHEVQLKESQSQEIDRFIEEISNEFRSIPQGKIRPLSEMSEWLSKFDLKIPLEFCKMKKNFQFLPPTTIEVIGSYAYDGLIVKSSKKTSILIDLLVEMPRICIHKKDYLNNEYLEKRAIFLCYLAKKLKQNNERSLEFAHLNDTTCNQPVLLVKPNEISKFAVRILLAPEENYLNEKRLSSSSSNLRSKWFDENDDETFVPTPNYNNLILFDCRLRSTSKSLKKTFREKRELINGLKLVKIWLEQRRLSDGFGSFSGAMVAFLFVHLLEKNKINAQMHSYQIFRIILVALTEDFHQFDSNVFYTLIKANVNRIQYEARLSLNFFNDSVVDHFQKLFTTSIEPIFSMDALIEIDGVEQCEKLLEKKSNKKHLLIDHLNDKFGILTRELIDLLEKGLKERIVLLCPVPNASRDETTWKINENVPKRTKIRLGILFSDQFDLAVLKGPENGSAEAEEFRRFWNERCELRRFPDGSILESVVWNVETAKDKRSIWMDVTRFLLETHGGISPTKISFVSHDQSLSSLLSIPTRLFPSYGSGDEQQQILSRVFLDLSKEIRSLNKNLPLNINNLVGLDETFRLTEVFPPLPASFVTDLHKIRSIEHESRALIPRSTSRYAPPFSQSLTIFCQLDSTNSTDFNLDSFERIQHVKILFYVQLAKLLEQTFGYACRPTNDCCYVEKENFLFRFVASHHKEIFILETQAGRNDGLERQIQTTNLSRKLRYQNEYLPKLNAAIHGISQQFAHFSIVTRLFKRWLASQMLLHHFDPINADLICSFVFLHPAPFQRPQSAFVGFLRVLRLIVEFDWLHEPLIINFNQKLTNEEIFDLQNQFKTDRSKLPAMCLMPSIAFHDNSLPTVPIFKRVVQLAKEAMNYIEKHNCDSIKFIFRPSLTIYDAIIVLDPLQCPRAYQAIDHLTSEVTYTTRKLASPNSETNKKKLLSIVDYDPAELFVEELRKLFKDQVEFFHDPFGGLNICVLWKPSKQPIDYVKIVQQWKLFGTGLVKEIQTFPERWP